MQDSRTKENRKAGGKLVKGAMIIGAAGVLVKVLGAFFRIPITNWMGADGMAYYGFAYAIYGMLLVIATAGIPVAISRLVSENIAQKRYRNAHQVFHISLILMTSLGTVLFVVAFFGAGFFTTLMGNPDARLAVRAISPALFFVPIVATFRGYFQGRQNMNPTAVSEITEQFWRIVSGLLFTYIFLKASLIKAAAGAAAGAAVGSGFAFLLLLLIYGLNKRAIAYKVERYDPTIDSRKSIAKQIVVIAVPIILGSLIMPIMNLIDTGLIMRRLQATGFSFQESNHLYGLISSYCSTLIGFPQIFTQAVAISLVPAIAKRAAMQDGEGVRAHVETSYRLTTFLAFPCAVGMFVLAEPILHLLYPANPEECQEALAPLMILAISIIGLALSQTSTGVLQSIGRQNVPVIHLLAGALLKIVLTYILVGIRPLNIKGAAISTICAYTLAALWNDRSVVRYTGIRFPYKQIYLKPLAASLVMGLCAYGAHRGLARLLPSFLATVLAILLGVIVYAFCALLIKAVRPEEVGELKGGDRINRAIQKILPSWEA